MSPRLLRGAARTAVASVWLYEGLWCKLLASDAGQRAGGSTPVEEEHRADARTHGAHDDAGGGHVPERAHRAQIALLRPGALGAPAARSHPVQQIEGREAGHSAHDQPNNKSYQGSSPIH